MSNSIAVLIAGGTIDKHYNPLNGKLELPATSVPEMLRQGRLSAHARIENVLLKDSLEMNDADRLKLLATSIHAFLGVALNSSKKAKKRLSRNFRFYDYFRGQNIDNTAVM